jgi:hypothetical protein
MKANVLIKLEESNRLFMITFRKSLLQNINFAHAKSIAKLAQTRATTFIPLYSRRPVSPSP